MTDTDFPILSKGSVCYLDNAATSLMPRQVIDAMEGYETAYRSNVARGIYPWAERATDAYESARATVARALGAEPGEIAFTSGTSASIDLAARLCLQLVDPGSAALVTQAEHHSNIVPWQTHYANRGGVRWAACGGDGRLDLDSVRSELARGGVGVVAVTHASNVTGEVVDLRAVAMMAREQGALMVVDGAQYMPHSFADPRLGLDADFYAFSAHKCNGPTGIGALWGRSELLGRVEPLTGGGGTVAEIGQSSSTLVDPPHSLEAGTPNIVGAIGLGAALGLRMGERAEQWQETLAREMRVFDGIVKLLGGMPKIEMLGHGDAGVPIVPFNVEGCHPHDVCQVLGERGVCVRGGHHCAQPMMGALGVDSCVRVSVGPHNVEGDVERLGEALEAAAKELA